MSSLDSTIGALEIANVVSAYLSGIIAFQTYFYFRNFPEDKPLLKYTVRLQLQFIFILLLSALDLGHVISSSHTSYKVTVSDFGQPKLLAKFPNSIEAALLFEGLITTVVQAFFIMRVHRLSKVHKIIIYFFSLCAALRLAASVSLTVFGVQSLSLNAFVADWSWLLTSLFSLGAFVDIGISLCLCLFFYSQRGTCFAR
ncbi:hypothetical protein BDP27DRAFT_1236964 [Rhodocollybia butyracea]|uniref:Uncharacterized protein n=1 Tax=Rhodocollybia butyracea TaxID=206335 RepID=A0A9P5U0B9_9AGAR|nr:hypothetical protein BDP27DRAFT_1236964 [Rhodocollybia butyracea]